MGAVTLTLGAVWSLMVNAASETSSPLLAAASWATTFTKALVVGSLGTVQLKVPSLVSPRAMVLKVPPAPLLE